MWETIFRKAQIFQITNELYDPDNEEFSNETITDWDKVINYIKNEDAYEGKNGKKFFLPATMKNDLLKWAEGERDNQEARIRLEKEKRKDEGLTFLTKEVLTQYDEKNPSAYITEAEIREKGVAAVQGGLAAGQDVDEKNVKIQILMWMLLVTNRRC